MTEDTHTAERGIERRLHRLGVTIPLVWLAIMAMGVAAGQSSGASTGFCDVRYVGDVTNTAFSIFIPGAIAIGMVTWVATSFTEALPVGQDLKSTLKRQRNSAVASGARAIFVPALLLAFLSVIGVGVPDCVSILP